MYVYMQRRMHSLRLAENASGTVPFFIATRKFLHRRMISSLIRRIYIRSCPCLKCTIKIIQTGVKEVVYNLSYKV